jgi:Glyoxalase-like domain
MYEPPPGSGATLAALEAEAERLVSHGATPAAAPRARSPLGAGHIVMADPEDTGFCLD